MSHSAPPGLHDRMTGSWTSSGQWHPVSTTAKTTTKDSDIYRVGIYGWRKRCLYALIVLLTVIIIINLALTIWILKVLDFHSNGMGALKIHRGGITVSGDAQFMKPVYVRKLRSGENEPLVVESDRTVTINARNASGGISSRLYLGPNQAQAVCDRFEIFDDDHELIFSADKDEVAVRVENMRILGKGGSVFENAVQTSLIRPESGQSLRIESPSGKLEVQADQDLEINSANGDVRVKAVQNVLIQSSRGEVHFRGQDFYFQGLPPAASDSSAYPQYQVCICKVDGRLFLARNGADCRASDQICRLK